jgi:hypothetical protein
MFSRQPMKYKEKLVQEVLAVVGLILECIPLVSVPRTELGPAIILVASGHPAYHISFLFFVFWGNYNSGSRSRDFG